MLKKIVLMFYPHYCILDALHQNQSFVQTIISIYKKYINYTNLSIGHKLSHHLIDDISMIISGYRLSIPVDDFYEIIDKKMEHIRNE